jgi:acyl-homoserine lactone acylase PvdQ
MRRPLVFATAALLAWPAATFAAAGSGTDAASVYDGGGATLNILPPGSNGNVNAADFAALHGTTASASQPTNYANQLEMYDALNTIAPYSLKQTDLTKYYKDAPIDPPANPTSTETPKDGVTIARDSFGVPHIVGTTDDDVAYGAGYAGVEDRMFLIDLLRHVGAAQMASFLGPSAANIAMDQSQLLTAPYTDAEANAQLDALAQEYGAEGQAALARLDAFVAGMNAAEQALCPGAFGLPVPGGNGVGFGPNCPVEYSALQKSPAAFTRADVLYIASLVGGIFGKGGGNEYQDALFYEALRQQFGATKAKHIYTDLREKNDPEAFTSASTPFPYLSGPLSPGRAGVALPVPGAETAPGTAAPASASEPVAFSAPPVPGTSAYQHWQHNVGRLSTPTGTIDLSRHPDSESNALLVDAKHSADGHPVVVFGPQTGYFTPQLLTEVALDGPDIKARGVAFAGTQLLVELGHGVDYAWSATSASGDNVDTVMDRLCNADGSPATVQSTSYIDDSSGTAQCVPIDTYTHDEGVTVPTAGGTGQPQELTFTVMKTRHGVVQFRTLAYDGTQKVPVAVVSERSTYNHELDSAIGFFRANNPNYVHSAKDFESAFASVGYTFNWFYADPEHIAYFNSGDNPVRARGVNTNFPVAGRFAWRGWNPETWQAKFTGFARHPQAVDQKYLVNWNNKQARGFASADANAYSSTYRSVMLEDQIKQRLAHGGKMTLPKLIDAMEVGGSQDLRAHVDLPPALKVLGRPADPALRGAVDELRAWLADGGLRKDANRDGTYEHSDAIRILDAWWPLWVRAEFEPVVGKTAFDRLTSTLTVDDTPNGAGQHHGSAYQGSWYGFVSKDLRTTLGRHVRGRYARRFCGSLKRCRRLLRQSLAAAVKIPASTVYSGDSACQAGDQVCWDAIRQRPTGGATQPLIEWINRPTFQQAVEVQHFVGR